MDLQAEMEKTLLQLNELEEFINEAYENAKIFKEKTKAWHDKHIIQREFKPGQQVLLFNSRLILFLKKLKSKWPEPFTIIQVFPHGGVKVSHPEKGTFKVNGQRLTSYFGGDFNATKASIILEPP